MTVTAYLLLASLFPSTTYGYGEIMCGDVGQPRACSKGAVTASGLPFNTAVPQVALAMPTDMRIKARKIRLRIAGGKCQWVMLADKMNERWIGARGFDLNPAAQALLTGKPAVKHWTGRVELCTQT
jgi:hypothetical protein